MAIQRQTDISMDEEIHQAALELYIEHKSNHLAYVGMIAKSIGLPHDADPTHEYSHRSGEYGDYRYYWFDRSGNYWVYSNAPEDHLHYDPRKGEPFIDPKQPMPHTSPEFFTSDGRKRHKAVPGTVLPQQNASYNTDDSQNTWFESYQDPESGEVSYVYLDSDVRNIPALYMAYNLRVVDSNIPAFRTAIAKMIAESGSKSRVIGTVLALVDQGYFTLDELIDASTGDLSFVGSTVKLLGRKLVVDEDLFKFLVSMKAHRDDTAPLFMTNSNKGVSKIGRHHISAVLEHYRISAPFLQAWHATQLYVRCFSRLMAEGKLTTPEEVDQRAIYEVGLAMSTDDDTAHLISPQVRVQLLMNYLTPQELSETFDSDPKEPTENQMGIEAETNAAADAGGGEGGAAPVSKSISANESDEYGVAQVNSMLDDYTETERQFSTWLHQQPLHMLGILPDAAWWEDADVPEGFEAEPVVAEEEPVEVQKSLAPVTITIVRSATSSNSLIHGWSTETLTGGPVTDIAKALSTTNFDAVYTSDLPRTLPTALAIVSHQENKPKIYRTNSLRTYNFGVLTGQPMSMAKSMMAEWPEAQVAPLHGESYHTFEERVINKFDEIVKSAAPGSSLCFVMHGLPALLVQSYVLSSLGYGQTATILKGLHHDPGAYSQVRYVDGEYQVMTLNSKG